MSHSTEPQLALNTAILCRRTFSSLINNATSLDTSVLAEITEHQKCMIAFNNIYVSIVSSEEINAETICDANESCIVYINEDFLSDVHFQNERIVALVSSLNNDITRKLKETTAHLLAVFNDVAVLAGVDYVEHTINYKEIEIPFIHINISVPESEDISEELDAVQNHIDSYIESVR